MKPRGVLAPILGSALFFCLAPLVVAGIVPGLLAGWRMGPPLLGLSMLRVLGAALAAAGAASILECFARFALEGRGTPAPVAPAATLVVSGQYRHLRNPMYVAVVTAVLGQALLFGSISVLAYGVVVWGACHSFVIAYEEPRLERADVKYRFVIDMASLK